MYAVGQPLTDTDFDGIPDVWERAHKLNPLIAHDAAMVSDNGYTWIERYVNELADAK